VPEPKLCPDCPLRSHLSSVRSEAYTKTESEQSKVNLCSKLRALARSWGWPNCKHFPETETMEAYLHAKPKATRKILASR